MLRFSGWSAAGVVAVLMLAGPATAQVVEEGKARKLPWSGYWWPHKQGLLVGPLGKYDTLAGTGGKAVAWEKQNHPSVGAAGWWGYCHAWSAAAVTEAEPSRPFVATGPGGNKISLTVGDIKGLLTACHASDPANVYGQRYNGPNDDISDIKPDVLWKYLKLYVKQQGLPLVIDVDAGPQVWNYPVYMYRVSYTNTGGDAYQAVMQLWLADDAVQPDYVGVKVMTRTYQFTFKMRNGAVVAGSGQWTGASVKDHPDFAWYPTKAQPENPNLHYPTVVKAIGRRDADAEIAPPPANPPVLIPDPNNPPQPIGFVPEAPPPPLPNPMTPNGPPVPPPPTVVLSPTELVTLVASRKSKKSDFSFDIKVGAKAGLVNPIVHPGERIYLQGAAQKAGYVYVFQVDPAGDFKLIFPLPGQANVYGADKAFTIGTPADPTKAEFNAPAAPGTHRVLAFITTRPLKFSNITPVQKQTPDEKPVAEMNPTTKEWVKGLLAESGRGGLKPEKIQADTGIAVEQLPFEFAMAEAVFVVDPAKEK